MSWDRVHLSAVFAGLFLFGRFEALAQGPPTEPDVVPLPEVLVTAPARLPGVPLPVSEIPA
ncbi:MAG TPA: hypothetical protein VFF86_09905, partial [Candidatus Methylomirabilis sp.]|nr:hypothetical protein [Candidatus Methylomirabilis sp.]